MTQTQFDFFKTLNKKQSLAFQAIQQYDITSVNEIDNLKPLGLFFKDSQKVKELNNHLHYQSHLRNHL